MLSPTSPASRAQKNLSEEDSSESDAGSEVGLEPETDRFGFILTNGSTAGSVGPPPELVRQRETKWINIIVQWDRMLLKKTSKVKVQCQKGIPASLRAKCWPLLCAATERMKQNENLYESLDHQPTLQSWVDVIERDLDRQFPFHEMFLSKDGHGQRGLFRVLKAYTQYRPEEGYCQAQGPVAAVLLMNMPAEEAFWCLVQISEQYLPGYYSPLLEGVLFDAGMLTWVLKRTCPAAHKHLQRHGVEPLMFATDWLMCLFTRHLPFNTLVRVWDLFFCYGVRVLLQVAVVLVRRVLGHAAQRKLCQGQMETLERLRGVREQVQEEEDTFIAEVCSVPLSDRDLEKQTEKELEKWRKDRPSSTFDPRGRCQGYRMAWARIQQNKEERERKAREKGNLSVPLSRSASTLSLSPSLFHKRLRKGGKVTTGVLEGGVKVARHLSMGAKEDWRSWSESNFNKVQEEECAEERKKQSESKLTGQTREKELLEKTKKMDKIQNIPKEHAEEQVIVKQQNKLVETGISEKKESQPKETEDDKMLSEHTEETNVGTEPNQGPTKDETIGNILEPTEHTSHCDHREELDSYSRPQALEQQKHKGQGQETEVTDRKETETQMSESERSTAVEEKPSETQKDDDAHTYTDEEMQADPDPDPDQDPATFTDPDPEMFKDPDPATFKDPDPDPATSKDPDPNPAPLKDPGPAMFKDPDPEMFKDPDPDPDPAPLKDPDPAMFKDPDPAAFKDPDPDPATFTDPDPAVFKDPDPATFKDPDPDPATSKDPDPDPDPATFKDPDADPDPDPDPDPATFKDPNPATFKDPDPDPDPAMFKDPGPATFKDPDPATFKDLDADPDPATFKDPNPATFKDPEPDPATFKDPDADTDTATFTDQEPVTHEEEEITQTEKSSQDNAFEAKYQNTSTESLIETEIKEESQHQTENETEEQVEESAGTQDGVKTGDTAQNGSEQHRFDSKPETRILIFSLPCIQQEGVANVTADTEGEDEIPVAGDLVKDSSDVFAHCSEKECDTAASKPAKEEEEIVLSVHSEASQSQAEAPTEAQTNVETTDSVATPEKKEASKQTEAVTLITEADRKTSSVELAASETPAPEDPTSQVTTGPFDEEESTKNFQENSAVEDDVFISTLTVTDNPHAERSSQDQSKDISPDELVNSGMSQASGHRSSRSSGDLCVRKPPSSRGPRLVRRLSEDLFTAPEKTSQSQSLPGHPQDKFTESQTCPGAVDTAPTPPDVTSEVTSSQSAELIEGAAAEPEPPNPSKRFGLFRRLRGEQPEKAKKKRKQKMQVPKILIQDFSNETGTGTPVEEEGEEKLSSRERRRQRRERERREKEEERLRRKKEKELEKERERERREKEEERLRRKKEKELEKERERERREKEEERLRRKKEKELEKEKERQRKKPQTRGKSFQVQMEKGSKDLPQPAQTRIYSASCAESYF